MLLFDRNFITTHKMAEKSKVRYFKAHVGAFISNGSLSYKFLTQVVALEDEQLINLLEKSVTAVEIEEKEAKELSSNLFKKEDKKSNSKEDKKSEESDDEDKDENTPKALGDMNAKELKVEAVAVGVDPEVMKTAKNVGDLRKMIEDKKSEESDDKKKE